MHFCDAHFYSMRVWMTRIYYIFDFLSSIFQKPRCEAIQFRSLKQAACIFVVIRCVNRTLRVVNSNVFCVTKKHWPKILSSQPYCKSSRHYFLCTRLYEKRKQYFIRNLKLEWRIGVTCISLPITPFSINI